MQIETKRLILRDYVFEDWVAIHEYSKEPEFSKYDVWGPNAEKDTQAYVNLMIDQARSDARYKFDLAVVDRPSLQAIGGVGVRRDSEDSAVGNLGYSINPEFQKRGLATECVGALLDFGFRTLGLQVVWATCDVLNPASYRVMEKSGMKRVGHMIKHKEFKGQWHDSYRYEIIRSAYGV